METRRLQSDLLGFKKRPARGDKAGEVGDVSFADRWAFLTRSIVLFTVYRSSSAVKYRVYHHMISRLL